MLGFIKNIIKKLSIAVVIFLCAACDNNYQPKPKGYNQIFFPSPQYKIKEYNKRFSFERNIISTTTENLDYGWLNLSYPKYKAELLLTYKKVSSYEHLKNLINESYKLISKHKSKSSSITEKDIVTLSGKRATIITIEGEVPTPFQFIITDSSKNFLRAALYFEKPIANDSISPVVEYIKKDMIHILNTLSWNE